jgi:hypothetical protein
MARSKTCPKCQSAMVEGFLLDHGDAGRRHVGAWVEGAPRKSFWTGLSLRGLEPVEVTTWRCRSCGFLESYAGG